jgi:DNA-binding XRE family transcriptional regulator
LPLKNATADDIARAERYRKQVGERLAAIRGVAEEAPMTQKEFGKRIGCSQQTVNNWEKGRCSIDPFYAVQISERWGFTTSWLYEGKSNATLSTVLLRRLADA